MLRSALVWVFAGAAVAVALLFFAAQDVERLQAQEQTPAQICAALITDATKTSLRSDCAALLAIKDTLRGTANLDWGNSGVVFDDPTGEADDWDGITVAELTILGPPPNYPHLQVARVTEIDLSGRGLRGTIPDLSTLNELQVLDLGDNELTGSLPAWISSLLSGRVSQIPVGNPLTRLDLSGNQLTGTIPSEWSTGSGNFSNLTYLNLGNNGLTGMIPANLFSAHMPVLEHLYLNDNRFSGAIPPNWGNTGGTYHLTHLYLNGNEFGSGPLENDLSGTDTSFLFQLTRLTHLDLSDNNLGGIIRGEYFDTQSSGPTWADLSQLEYLNLSDNHLTGGIPTTLERATAAKEIDLSGNRLTGDIVGYFETGGLDDLNNLSGLSNLERLYLNDNQLSGTISAQLGNLTNLQELWLHNNALTGEVPSELSELTMLRDIRVHGNMLTGGYEVVIGLTGLESVGLPTELFADSGRWIGNSFLNLSLPSGADPSQSSVTLTPVSLDPEDVHVPSHPGISRIVRVLSSSAVEIVLEYRDAEGNLLEGIPGAPAVVCIPVPAEEADEELVLLKSDDGGATWTALARADIYADSAVCGMTDSFSLFVPAVAEGVLGFRGAGGTGGLIGRIEPSIRDVTVSQGDTIRLSFDIYGRQDILNNDLGIGHVFIWDDGGAGGSIRTTDRANTITYTAPSSPGTHVVTATSPRIACLIGEDAEETAERCNAKFTIKVRRPSAVPEERPAPKNPVGEIPSVLADAEGRQYDVFTPEQGGFFDDGEVTLSAEPGVVPNLEIVGARVDAAGPASNVGMTRQRYTLVGDRYDVLAVDATETSISSYVLNAPLEVCVPLPPEARHDLSNVAIVVNNPDGTLTVLSASVRITQAGINVCGNLGTLPASIAVGTAGSPDAIPTAVPDPDEIADPDTGGYAPSRNGLLMLVMMMIVGGVIVLGGVLLARRRQNV